MQVICALLTFCVVINVDPPKQLEVDKGLIREFVKRVDALANERKAMRKGFTAATKYEMTSSYLENGSISTFEIKKLQDYIIKGNQWVFVDAKEEDESKYKRLIIRNAKFDYMLDSRRGEYSLQRATRLTSTDSNRTYTDGFGTLGFPHYFETAGLVVPSYSISQLLQHPDSEVRKIEKSEDGSITVEIYYGGSSGIRAEKASSYLLEVDAEGRLKSSTVNYTTENGKVVLSHTPEYGIESKNSLLRQIPKRVVHDRRLEGAPYGDVFVFELISITEDPVSDEVFQPETYGIPHSALEAMAPQFIESEQAIPIFWIWLAVAVGCFAISWILYARQNKSHRG